MSLSPKQVRRLQQKIESEAAIRESEDRLIQFADEAVVAAMPDEKRNEIYKMRFETVKRLAVLRNYHGLVDSAMEMKWSQEGEPDQSMPQVEPRHPALSDKAFTHYYFLNTFDLELATTEMDAADRVAHELMITLLNECIPCAADRLEELAADIGANNEDIDAAIARFNIIVITDPETGAEYVAHSSFDHTKCEKDYDALCWALHDAEEQRAAENRALRRFYKKMTPGERTELNTNVKVKLAECIASMRDEYDALTPEVRRDVKATARATIKELLIKDLVQKAESESCLSIPPKIMADLHAALKKAFIESYIEDEDEFDNC